MDARATGDESSAGKSAGRSAKAYARAFARRTFGEGLFVAAVAGTTALLVDGTCVAIGRASAATGLACGLASASLIALVTLCLSPALGVLTSVLALLARGPRAARALGPILLAACSLFAAAEMAPTPIVGERRPGRHYTEVLLLTFSVAIPVLAACARSSRRAARAVAGLVALVTLTADVAIARVEYSDAHDLAGVLLVASLVALLAPLELARRLRDGRYTPHLFFGALLASIATAMLVDPVRPGWRVSADHFGRFEPPVAELLRHIVDFDRDGFSAVAWGGDCDDLDPTRHPLAREHVVGRDQNCNGIPLPAHDTDADRGLAPAAGNPDLPKGAIDTVLLVSIDCLRYDAFTPDVMPHATALATEGIVFRRAYASGTRTHLSFLLMQRGTDEAEPVAARLGARGVHGSAVLAFRDPKTFASETAGFEHVDAPSDLRWWNATHVTDEAIDALKGSSGPTYVWVHYIDAHDPKAPVPSDVPAIHRSYPSALYLSELAWIDRELGRLLGELRAENKKAVVVLTSDHGEGLGAHDVKYHGVSTYEELVHIPAFMAGPGIAPEVYEGLASHRDLPATILGAFGFVAEDPSVERFGRSWLRVRGAPGLPLHEFVVARSDRTVTLAGFVQPQAAIIDGDLKLVRTFEDGLTELFDLAHDPAERAGLDPASGEGPELARKLEQYRDLDGYP